ncbi:MAG: SGNH/GDSL hydrolase family protein, partial [Verrucomicrobiae bacterium]|nr:SGNH/GDSL hydrolase family protein [Verrucomicrobiae bacterium]
MLYLDFVGRAMAAFILAGPDSGILEVSVDGGEWSPVPLFHRFSTGLNYPRSVILAEDLPAGFHQIALRTSETKPEGSQGTAASILKLSINE